MAGIPLADLEANFYGAGGSGITSSDGKPSTQRSGLGLIFDCPCGCGSRRGVPFTNPLDGGEPLRDAARGGPGPTWKREGESLADLTLSPSLRDVGGCGWHGWIRDGMAVSV